MLELTRDDVREAWGLSTADLHAADWSACQEVARRARSAGFEAIRFPSASGSGENLAIFLDRLHADSFVRIRNEHEVRADLA